MSADDPLDALTGSVSDGNPVDWDITQSGVDDREQESIRGLREVERIALAYRMLQRLQVTAGDREHVSVRKHGPMTWGNLTVLELARAGATGEVWRAWDQWLQREVALKFLQVSPGGSVGESALLEEAQSLARVRHPGVVAVHGIAEHDGRVGMWMEFIEGSTLAAEIERRGKIPPREVAEIGLALCRALEAVESAGIVHRDIKPANVILETTGRVVLTDFGLGRRWELANPSWRASGTPVFMSPGVLSGEPATPRSDLYALGVTLRWALTGRSPFTARNFEELEIEARTGPSTTLAAERPDAPAALVAAIDRAMAPNADDRYVSAGAMAAALEAVIRSMEREPHEHLLPAIRIVAVAIVAALAAFGLSRVFVPRPRVPAARFSVLAPLSTEFDPDPMSVTISPDGLRLAFVAIDSTGTGRVWVRPLNVLEARPIQGTDDAQGLFWSPDSRDIGFFAHSKLKKVRVAGGMPEIVCDAPDARGGTWGKSGMIVFAPVPTGPLCAVSSNGGPVRRILEPDSTRHETALRWPQFLPDGRHVLFVSLPPRKDGFDVYVASIDSHIRRIVAHYGTAPVVAGSRELVFARNGHLMAQRFDFGRLRPLGDPSTLGPATSSDHSVGEPLVSASMNGVLAYQSAVLPNTQLVWLDRSGQPHGTLGISEGRYENAVFSPDGRRLLLVRRTAPSEVDLWSIDLATGASKPLTSRSQSRIGGMPAWSPDGRNVAFSSNRDGPTNIYVKHLDQGGPEEVLYQSSTPFKDVDSWSPDGWYLFFEQADPVTGWDVWMLPLRGERRPVPYLRTKFFDGGASLSPDGKWMCYECDESGAIRIYVQAFPSAGEKHLISVTTAILPKWSNDGREVLLHGSDGGVWVVPIATSPTFRAGAPSLLFTRPRNALMVVETPDHRRFLASVPARDAPPSSITVELNWQADGKRFQRRHRSG